MKSDRWNRLGITLLLLGAMLPAVAAQEQHGGPGKPMEQPRQEQHGGPGRPQEQGRQEQRPQGMGQGERRPEEPSREPGGQRQPQARGQQERPHQAEPQRQQARAQQSQEHAGRPGQQRGHAGGQQAMFQDHRAHDFHSEHRSWQQRGGYRGTRIPEGRFRGHFGEDHGFRMSSYPMRMYGGHPRFQYGGFWMNVMDPFPEYWAADWYGNDDVYIGFSGGGYYLYNRSYPQDQIAISVSL